MFILSGLCLSIFCFWFTLFSLSFPIAKFPDQITSVEHTFSHSHVPSSISVTDQVWLLSLPPLAFISEVCFPVCSHLWLPSFLITLCCIERSPWSDILKKQTLSFHIPLQKHITKAAIWLLGPTETQDLRFSERSCGYLGQNERCPKHLPAP